MQPLDNIDFACTYLTLKGVRRVMIPQHRTLYELEQAVAAGELKTAFDPFPFAVVQTSRVSLRDPIHSQRQQAQHNPFERLMPPVPTYTIKVNGAEIVKHKKFCGACGEWQRQEAFSPDKRNRDGLHSHCKSCRAEKARAQYWEDKLRAA